MRNLYLLQARAWYQLAVAERGFNNVEVDPITIAASLALGFTTPKKPMQDLTECITQAVFEHYEPDLQKLDNLPDLSKSVELSFSSDSTDPIIVSHQNYRVPTGFLVLDQNKPVVLYATDADRSLWTITSFALRCAFLVVPETPETAIVRVGIL